MKLSKHERDDRAAHKAKLEAAGEVVRRKYCIECGWVMIASENGVGQKTWQCTNCPRDDYRRGC